MRCNSAGLLYYLSATSSPTPPCTFVVLPPELWHNRLGPPSIAVINHLRNFNFISCNKGSSPNVCHGCQLVKHTRLPFVWSTTKTCAPFDIIYTDLFTLPGHSYTSYTGFCYYLLFLDEFSHFLLLFPLKSIFDVFSIIVNFHSYGKT